MSEKSQNVQKLDAQHLDIFRSPIARGLYRYRCTRWLVKLDVWRGSFTTETTTTTLEPTDDRH